MKLYILEGISFHQLQHFVNIHQNLGVLIAFLIPFADSFLGIIPLGVICATNVNVFGFWPGFLATFVGSVLGTTGMYFLLRMTGARWLESFIQKRKKKKSSMGWLANSGFGPVFLWFCIPFCPSFITNIFASVSKIRPKIYIIGFTMGKLVALLLISFIGQDLDDFIEEPIESILVLIAILILWYVGKKVEKSFMTRRAK
ncbi:TVP38/TMEM64 family protein [Gottfriedia acidiceleris]|uniref:TVP38/TMEM64 family protein n=1 Tax=Gottfriedia acidiceleris TaxID=371036 RepID=UPI002FFE1897